MKKNTNRSRPQTSCLPSHNNLNELIDLDEHYKLGEKSNKVGIFTNEYLRKNGTIQKALVQNIKLKGKVRSKTSRIIARNDNKKSYMLSLEEVFRFVYKLNNHKKTESIFNPDINQIKKHNYFKKCKSLNNIPKPFLYIPKHTISKATNWHEMINKMPSKSLTQTNSKSKYISLRIEQKNTLKHNLIDKNNSPYKSHLNHLYTTSSQNNYSVSSNQTKRIANIKMSSINVEENTNIQSSNSKKYLDRNLFINSNLKEDQLTKDKIKEIKGQNFNIKGSNNIKVNNPKLNDKEDKKKWMKNLTIGKWKKKSQPVANEDEMIKEICKIISKKLK